MREGGFGDRFVEGRAVDPVAQNRIDPDARFRRSVEVELLFEHSVAVDLPQVAHPAQVAAQRPDASVAADAEDDGRIADAVKGASLPVPAQLHLAQRACQAVGIGECEQVLAKGEHVVRWVLSVVRSVGDGARCEKVRMTKPDPRARLRHRECLLDWEQTPDSKTFGASAAP